MKTIKQILLIIVVLLLSLTANAYDFEVDGIYYYILSNEDLTVEAYGRNDTIAEVIIPSAVIYDGNEYSVTTIGYMAFYNCSSLTSITIPNSVTSIKTCAFENCTSLTNVTFEENSQLITIGCAAFRRCSSLIGIEIPRSVTTIGYCAFDNCTSLTSMEIPNSVIYIGAYVVEDDDVFHPSGVFRNCTSLKSVIFEENSQVTYIAWDAFEGCSSLTSITIPNSVTNIRESAFSSCSSLTSVIFGENSQLTTIGPWAFYNCSSLTSITIPNSVTNIRESAFHDCSSLASIEMPNSITIIEESVFEGCSSLTSITIPNSVTSIGESAFGGCSSLTSVEIPISVTSIEEYTFYGCSSLTSITIPNSVTSIRCCAFENCSSLTSVKIGYGVENIEESAFSGCSSLTDIYMAGIPPKVGEDNFTYAQYMNTTLYVPEGLLSRYKSANVWRDFINIKEYDSAGIEDIDVNIPNFEVTSNGISLLNADNNAIAIYSINGILVKKIDKYTGEEITLNKGVYIISVGNKAMKIKL